MGEKNRESGFVCLRSRLSDNALKQTKQHVGLFIGAACKAPNLSTPAKKRTRFLSDSFFVYGELYSTCAKVKTLIYAFFGDKNR